MIEPTDEMRQALREAKAEGCGTCNACLGDQVAAVLAILERDYDVQARQAVHLAVKGDSYVHCCGTELLDLPRGHRWTLDPHGVTCKGPS